MKEKKTAEQLLEEMHGSVATLVGQTEENKKVLTELGARVEKIEEAQRSRIQAASLPDLGKDAKKFMFVKAIRGITAQQKGMPDAWKGAEFERDVMHETAKKALDSSDDTAGGYLIPEQVVSELIPLLRAKTVALELGARMLDGLVGGPVVIPSQTNGATAEWIGPNSSITDTDQKVGQKTLTPRKLAAMTKLDNSLLRRALPSVEQMVREDLAAAMGRKLDLAALRGTGESNQPLGILNTPGVSIVAIGTNGGDFKIDHAYDMETEVEEADVDIIRGGFATRPLVHNKLRKTRSDSGAGAGTGEYLFQPVPQVAVPKGLIGYPLRTTTQIPKNLTKGSGTNLSEVYFGNWPDLIIGQWGGMELLASNVAGESFQKDQTWIRVIQEADVLLRYAKAFAVCKDAKTAA